MSQSILQKIKFNSPLLALKRVRTQGGNGKEKQLFFSLNLTTLIDAFCILVIFLLSNMNGQLQNLQQSKSLVLPSAVQTNALNNGVVVRIENNSIFMEDKKIESKDIAEVLLKAKKAENSLIIQADRKSQYQNIGMILRAGGQAGFEKYVFAVLPGI